MKRILKTFCLLFVAAFFMPAFGQTNDAKPLNFKQTFFSNGWEEDGVKVSRQYAKERFKTNSPLAYDLYKQGRTADVLSTTLSIATGFALGVTLVAAPNMTRSNLVTNSVICGIGAVTSIIYSYYGTSRYIKATQVYNDALEKKKVSLNLGATNNGIGLALKF